MTKVLTVLVTLAAAMLLSGVAAADVIYAVTVDTSSLNATTGSLDFQLAPGVSVLPATATVSNFNPLAGVGAGVLSGDANGTLNPGPLTLGNSTAFNDFFVDFAFGNSLSFTVTFSGQVIDSPDPINFPDASTFAFSIFDQTSNPFGNNPFGFLVTVDLNGDGTTSPEVFAPEAGIELVQPPPPGVPEPSMLPILPFALAGLGLMRRKSDR